MCSAHNLVVENPDFFLNEIERDFFDGICHCGIESACLVVRAVWRAGFKCVLVRLRHDEGSFRDILHAGEQPY